MGPCYVNGVDGKQYLLEVSRAKLALVKHKLTTSKATALKN